VIGLPARVSQHSCNPAITVSPILAGQFDHIGDQPIFICLAPWDVSLGRSMLLEDATGPALGYGQMFTDMMDALAATCGA